MLLKVLLCAIVMDGDKITTEGDGDKVFTQKALPNRRGELACVVGKIGLPLHYAV